MTTTTTPTPDPKIEQWLTDHGIPFELVDLDLDRIDAKASTTNQARDLPVTRHVLPHLRALNFLVEGILGEGVTAQARFDPQAKALGEWLRSRHLDIPEALL